VALIGHLQVAQKIGAASATPSAASSGSLLKAPGSAGGYLLPVGLTHNLSVVMPGLVPGTHVFRATKQGVGGRDKPGHDELGGST